MSHTIWGYISKIYLSKANILGIFTETLTTNVQAIFPDQSVVVWAGTTVKNKRRDYYIRLTFFTYIRYVDSNVRYFCVDFTKEFMWFSNNLHKIHDKCVKTHQTRDPWPYLRGCEYHKFWKPILIAFLQADFTKKKEREVSNVTCQKCVSTWN